MRRRITRARGALPLVLALALALAACGSSRPASTTATAAAGGTSSTASTTATHTRAAAPPAGPLALAADPGGALRFTDRALAARAGTVTIRFTNHAPFGHNLTVAGPDGAVLGATPTFQGGVRALTLHLRPGTYTFFCSVPGHRMAGMQGTLTVR